MIAIIPYERIESRIFLIRGQRVMLDSDLAKLYRVPTKVLKQSVRRNRDRFPDDFMFELTKHELEDWRSQFVTSKSQKMGLRYRPFVFTEHGVAMLSTVLNSKQAIAINIQIIRSFIKLRNLAMSDDVLLRRIEVLEKNYDERFKVMFDALRRMYTSDEEREEIGFKARKS